MTEKIDESNSKAEIEAKVDESKRMIEDKQAQQLTSIVARNKEMVQKLQKAVIDLVRISNDLPKHDGDFDLYVSYPDYAEFLKQQKTRIILAMRKLVASSGSKAKIPMSGLEDMESVIFANDFFVETAGTWMDKHNSALAKQFLSKTRLVTNAAIVPGSVRTSATSILPKKDAISYYNMQVAAGSCGVKDASGGPYANLASNRSPKPPTSDKPDVITTPKSSERPTRRSLARVTESVEEKMARIYANKKSVGKKLDTEKG